MKLGTALYRDLLRNGKKFDRFPVLKACLIYKKTLPIGDVFESEWKELISLKNGHYYKPGIQFQDEIRKRFQQAKTLQKDSPDLHKLIDLGFATLKRLNTILTKTKGMVDHNNNIGSVIAYCFRYLMSVPSSQQLPHQKQTISLQDSSKSRRSQMTLMRCL